MKPRTVVKMYAWAASLFGLHWLLLVPLTAKEPVFRYRSPSMSIQWEWYALILLAFAFSRMCYLLDATTDEEDRTEAVNAHLLLAGWLLYLLLGAIIREISSVGLNRAGYQKFGIHFSWAIYLAIVGGFVFGALRYHFGGLVHLYFLFTRRRHRYGPWEEQRGATLKVRETEGAYREAEREVERKGRVLKMDVRSTGENLDDFFRSLRQHFETVPADIGEYHGFVKEHYIRFVENQKKRTMEITRERIEEVTALYLAWIAAETNKRALALELARSKEVEKEIRQTLEIERLTRDAEAEGLRTHIVSQQVERTRLETEMRALSPPKHPALGEGRAEAGPVLPLVIARAKTPGGSFQTVRFPAEARAQHSYIIGKTQFGKTTLIVNMVRQDIEQGYGVVFLDAHGNAAPKLLDYVPGFRKEDVIYLDLTLQNPVLAFNPLDVPAEHRVDSVKDFIDFATRKFSLHPDLNSKMLRTLENAVHTLAEVGGHTLVDIRDLIVNEDYRRNILTRVRSQDLLKFWTGERRRFGEDDYEPILNRFRDLLSSGSQLNAIFSQRENTLDFKDIVTNGRILIIRGGRGGDREATTTFIAAFMLARLQQAAMMFLEKNPDKPQRQLFVYLDEFHTYPTPSIDRLLNETLGFGVALRLANQNWLDIHEATRIAMSNVGPLVAFHCEGENAEYVHRAMRRPIRKGDLRVDGTLIDRDGWWPTPEILKGLELYEVFVRVAGPQDVVQAATMPLPPPNPPEKDWAAMLKESSLKRFYRPRTAATMARPPRDLYPPNE